MIKLHGSYIDDYLHGMAPHAWSRTQITPYAATVLLVSSLPYAEQPPVPAEADVSRLFLNKGFVILEEWEPSGFSTSYMVLYRHDSSWYLYRVDADAFEAVCKKRTESLLQKYERLPWPRRGTASLSDE